MVDDQQILRLNLVWEINQSMHEKKEGRREKEKNIFIWILIFFGFLKSCEECEKLRFGNLILTFIYLFGSE